MHFKLSNISIMSIVSILPLMVSLMVMTSCNQSSPKSDEATTAADDVMIYRPKVKLTSNDPDPAKLEKLLAGRELIYQEKYAEARKLLLPLAEAGYTDAQLSMADTYMPHKILNPTKPTKFDWEQGIPWLKRAADGGNAKAQWLLGAWYYRGSSPHVSRDYFATDWDKVNHYLLASAEQGFAPAQHQLAVLYDSAHGVEMNEQALKAYGEIHNVKAYMYYTLASQRYPPHDGNGFDRKGLALNSRNMLIEDHNLSQEQIAEGERLVQQWIRTHPDAYQVEYPPELYPGFTP
jgi:hypothetical protein